MRTLTGLVAIGALTLGTPVLAYNEATGQNEYDPITHIFKNEDPAITYLSIKDDKTGQTDNITTTPNHPFYLARATPPQPRPAPAGHPDLSSRWVGAGDLKPGDALAAAPHPLATSTAAARILAVEWAWSPVSGAGGYDVLLSSTSLAGPYTVQRSDLHS